ncbi:MAG: hypothetical protein DHS20C18_22280 [Saprospiraceae bacterium]|nr:MAG: hypothetical protein DHS20C18_22280 [Saprospiraceae bacterium]
MTDKLLSIFLLILGSIPHSIYGQCSFSVNNDNACAGEELTFSVDNPLPGMAYSWDLDADGQSDINGSSFTYTFPEDFNTQSYPILLFADGDTCAIQNIHVLAIPDITIGVPPGIVTLDGHEIRACNGADAFDLSIYNASFNQDSTLEYTFNWGDGSPPETFDNTAFSNLATISHTYSGLGYFTIFITAAHFNGCVYTTNYVFYNGGNPSVGLVIPGNTVGLCAPATLDFPIINTENNPPGTEYTIFINGEQVGNFFQENLPPVFTYTFEESSCGQTTSTGNYNNAFDIRIVASNPCNSSTATIEPIEVSSPPDPLFEVILPPTLCEGAVVGFENNSQGISEVISGNPSSCIDVLNPSWTLSGTAGEDWTVVSGSLFGSNTLEIEFLEPGVYTITMTLVSFACGPFTFSQQITIYEPPEPTAAPDLSGIGNNGDGCAPLTIPFLNESAGDQLSFNWSVDSELMWAFADSTNASSIEPIITFLEGGAYNILLDVTNPCATVSWDTMIFLPGPPRIDLVPLPDSCGSSVLQIDSSQITYIENGSAIDSYLWEFPGSNLPTSDQAFPSGIQYDSSGVYPVSLTVSNSCGTTIITDTFEVQAMTQLTLPPDRTLCASLAPFNLTAQPSGGSWSGPGIQENGLFDPALANTGSNQLTYSYGVGACFLQSTLNIDILPAPQVTVGPDLELCANENNQQLNAQPPNGLWSSSDGAVLNFDQLLTQNTGAGTFSLVYTYTDGNGCQDQDSLEALIHPVPDLMVGDSAYCNTPGSTPLPVASPQGGTWSGPGVTDPNGFFDPIIAGGGGNYVLTYALVDNNGCQAVEDVNISVIDPVNVDAGPDQSLCLYDNSIDLQAAANPPGGNWMINGSATTETIFNPETSGAGNYTLLYTVGSGSCRVEDSLGITVIAPTPIEAGPNIEICISPFPLSLSGSSPIGGIWTGAGITDDSGIFDPSIAQEGVHTLTYAVLDASSSCLSKDSIIAMVHPRPAAAFELPEVACTGQSVTIDNQSNGATTYQWTVGNDPVITSTTPTLTFQDGGNYSILLLATNAEGCTDETQEEIFIATPPEALFVPETREACGILDLQLSNESNGYQISYYWDLGNGTTSTNAIPPLPIQYPSGQNDTIYRIRLEVSNLCGTDAYKDSLLVHPYPLADFGFTVDTGCAPLTLAFANVSTGSPGSFFWDFGNGMTSTDSLPDPQIFEGDTTVITYPITLVAGNSCGADTITRELVIAPETVEAFFNVSNTTGCAPLEISFENFSTIGTFISWDFGDGNTSSLTNPTHIFSEPGDYLIKQYASNHCAEDSTSQLITVLPSPEIDFTHSPNLCSGQEIQFTSMNEGLAGTVWIFNHTDTSLLNNPVFTFPNSGVYDVTLTGTAPGTGCQTTINREISIMPAPTANITLSDITGCTPLQISPDGSTSIGDFFEWDFGDGNTSVSPNPVHSYTASGNYTLNLRVSNANGCYSDSSVSNIVAFPLPVAAFDMEKETNCGIPAIVHFSNQSTEAEGFIWNFGGIGASQMVNPTQTFNADGLFDIQLIASNTYGCLDTTEQEIQLYKNPIADFAIDSISGCQPMEVQFTNYSIGNQYQWIFGDGGLSNEFQPNHIYEESGFYDLSLIVAFDDLCFDTLQLSGGVEVLPQAHASFDWTAELLNGEPTGVIQFHNNSEQADQFFWDFGDGQTSQVYQPQHRYYENGLRQVYLLATPDYGCPDDTLFQLVPDLFGGLHVPNAFAPEQGSGETTLFLPKGVGLKEYHLQIFSPYGELLWETTELSEGQPAYGWDGSHQSYPLPQDVYVWKISAIFEDGRTWRGVKTKAGGYKRIGSVTLIR